MLNTPAPTTDKGAGFRSLGDAWADTPTAHGRLMLTVLGGLAEFKRELIRARTVDGRARQDARREDGAETEAYPVTEKGRATAHRRRIPLARDRAGLQRQP